MPPLPKHSLYALLLAWQLLLSACGPGTGGTGTGPRPVTAFAASYTSAPTTQGTGSPATTPGATAVPAPCTVACSGDTATATFSLQLQTDGITLASPCATFSYTGSWSVSSDGEISVTGLYTVRSTLSGTTSSVQQTATLSVVFANASADSASLTVRVQAASGAMLLGPVVLQRAISAATVGPGSTNQSIGC